MWMLFRGQDRAPARDVTRSKAIRTYRPRTPADFFKQEAVRFERARIDMNGSIVADGHNFEPLWRSVTSPPGGMDAHEAHATLAHML